MNPLSQLFIEFRKVSECAPKVLCVNLKDKGDFERQLRECGVKAMSNVPVVFSAFCETRYL